MATKRAKTASRKKPAPKRPRAKALAPKAAPALPGERPPQIVMVPQRTAGVRVNEDTALTLGAVWACVRVIAEDIAGLPWHVFERRSDGGRDARPDDPADWLLHTQANQETPAFQWRETMLAHCLLWGNGYSEIERDGAGRPVWLHQLAPDRVCPDRTASDKLVYDVLNPRGPNTVLEPNDVFHLRGLGFDGLVGYSVIRMAARSIGLGIALDEAACSTLANDSTPGGFIKHPAKLSDTAIKNLKESIAKQHGGPTNRRKLMVLEEGMDWVQTALSPDDLQFIQQRQLTPAEICRIFRVSPPKIADLLRATFSNIEELSIWHVTDTLVPWGNRLEGEADIKLFSPTMRGRRFAKLNFMGLLRGNTAARTAYYNAMLDRGVFDINDVLALEDLNPIGPDGEKRFVQANMQLLEKAGEQPPVPAPPAPPAPQDAPPSGQKPPPVEDEEDDVEDDGDLRMRLSVRPVLEEALCRAGRRANCCVRDALKRLSGTPERWAAWLTEQFEPDHRTYLHGALLPSCQMLARLRDRPEFVGQTALALFVDAHLGRLRALAMKALGPDGTVDFTAGRVPEAVELYDRIVAACAAVGGSP